MAFFSSATKSIPISTDMPQHIAVIMDGNGRWARKRFLPRVAGHKRGMDAVLELVKACVDHNVAYLTLFAFSSENWRRPADEVSFLMSLFIQGLKREVANLHENNIKLVLIGDRTRFNAELIEKIELSERLTANNTGLTLSIAANYGGRWDILQAVNKMHMAMPSHVGGFDEEHLAPHLAMHFAPEPDLFIRTGGEKRISNFMLWQLAYTELYFTDTLWPDFDQSAFNLALASYQNRERRFGRTSEQVSDTASNN
ncbi:UppS Undecaprenyl pyrophosphate synthase [Methylophilaceae bacterium]